MPGMDWKKGEEGSDLSACHLSGLEESTPIINSILLTRRPLYPPDHTTSPWLRDALLPKAVIHFHDYQEGQNKHITLNRNYIYFEDRKSITKIFILQRMCSWFRSIVLRSDRKAHVTGTQFTGLGIKRNEVFHLFTHSFNKCIADAGTVLGRESTELKRISK